MRVIAVDGGYPVAEDSPITSSVGVLYPGERVDLVVERLFPRTSDNNPDRGLPPSSHDEILISLDKE